MQALKEEIKAVEERMKKAEEWFESHPYEKGAYWDKCFNVFCGLLNQRAELYLKETGEEK